MTSVINRYYDPSTDQFLSIDPDVATTDQPYVFTNDDPLNAEDPTGLCSWYDIVCPAIQVTKSVTNFVNNNAIAVGGILLDGVSSGFDIAGAISGDAALGFIGTGFGYAGAVVSAIECKGGNKLGCIGLTFGAGSATAGLAEGVIELSTGESAATAVLKGVGLNLGAATATVDVAAIIVEIDKAIESSAKKTANEITKKKK